MVKALKIILRIGRKERYEFMCYVDLYVKYNVSMPDGASSGGRRPMPSTSSKEEFSHLVTLLTLLKIGFNALK